MKPGRLIMPEHSRPKVFQKVVWLAVPIGTIVTSVVFPLSAFTQQALIGLILIWIYVGAFVDFGLMS